MENKLTIQDIIEAIKSLPPKELVFKMHPILRTTQTVIKQGNEIFYPDDLKECDVKVIEFPVLPDCFDSPKFEVNYFEDEFMFGRLPKIKGQP